MSKVGGGTPAMFCMDYERPSLAAAKDDCFKFPKLFPNFLASHWNGIGRAQCVESGHGNW